MVHLLVFVLKPFGMRKSFDVSLIALGLGFGRRGFGLSAAEVASGLATRALDFNCDGSPVVGTASGPFAA